MMVFSTRRKKKPREYEITPRILLGFSPYCLSRFHHKLNASEATPFGAYDIPFP